MVRGGEGRGVAGDRNLRHPLHLGHHAGSGSSPCEGSEVLSQRSETGAGVEEQTYEREGTREDRLKR